MAVKRGQPGHGSGYFGRYNPVALYKARDASYKQLFRATVDMYGLNVELWLLMLFRDTGQEAVRIGLIKKFQGDEEDDQEDGKECLNTRAFMDSMFG